MPFDGHDHIPHCHVAGIRLALSEGPSADETQLIAWSDATEYPDHMWLVEAVAGEADTFTVRNVSTGMYMDLTEGSAADGTIAIGSHRTDTDSQKWVIRTEESDGSRWKIQNKAAGTFLDLLDGGGVGTAIVGWQGSWNESDDADAASHGHQHWLFEKLSQTGAGVHASLRACPALGQDFQSYLSDGLYLVLTQEQLLAIWRSTGLDQKLRRDAVFDCNDFTTVFKAEVAKWGNDNFKADGFAVLCGMMFGSNANGAHAYNWSVDRSDPSRVVFFEPQDGTFSDDAWGYQAQHGLF